MCRDHSDGPDVINTHFTKIVLVKGVFSPVPPDCGYFVPSQSENIAKYNATQNITPSVY